MQISDTFVNLGKLEYGDRHPVCLLMSPIPPVFKDVLIDSGVSILNLSILRNWFSLLKSVTGLHFLLWFWD